MHRNLGFIFDAHLLHSRCLWPKKHLSSKPVTRQLRCIRPNLDSSTAWTIATSIVHSKLDYCNSYYHSKSQLSRLQQIQNFLAGTVVKAPKLRQLRCIRSLNYLRITERIECKLLSLTYKVLTTIPNRHTFITSNLFNVLAVLALHQLLILLGHQHHPL